MVRTRGPGRGVGSHEGYSGAGMERMLCEQCSAVTYSAAARMLTERGDRCPRCGGVLAMRDGQHVTAPPEPVRAEDASARSTE